VIKGIGIDIVEVARIAESLKKEGFKEKVFTEDEITYCESKKAHAAESYAARFAAKEALGKALGTGVAPGNLTEIETLPDEAGVPQIHLHGEMLRRAYFWNAGAIFVSLSHTDQMAAAQVIVEAKYQ
jgi:holo-[acyl-carrier protein] synthase